MKSVALGLLLLLAFPHSSVFCQPIFTDNFWDRDGAITEDLIEKVERSVIVVDNATANRRLTGVLLFSGSEKYAITNSHLLNADSDEVIIYLTTKDGVQEKFQGNLVVKDTTTDVAILDISLAGKTTEELKSLGFDLIYDRPSLDIKTAHLYRLPDGDKFVVEENFADQSILRRGREVIFLGFPLNEGAKERKVPVIGKTNSGQTVQVAEMSELVQKSPIARFGRIASKMENGQFLIDAMVSHGSSGSPVFVRTSFTSKEDGRDKIDLQYKFAGIISRFRSDNISFQSEEGDVMNIPHNSGLGLVVSVTHIAEMLQSLRGKGLPTQQK
jgi:S1-C subfamily serine protease